MKTLKYTPTATKTLNLEKRQSAARRGYGSNWKKARLQYLMSHPLCVDCEAANRIISAVVVDHIIPHEGDQGLFWDRNNWQGLCKSHHSQKTASQDGGFGNRAVKVINPKPVSTKIGRINT